MGILLNSMGWSWTGCDLVVLHHKVYEGIIHEGGETVLYVVKSII
jgi:hypothetical protein